MTFTRVMRRDELSLSFSLSSCDSLLLEMSIWRKQVAHPLLKRTQPWRLNSWWLKCYYDERLLSKQSQPLSFLRHLDCPVWALNWAIPLEQVFIQRYHSSCWNNSLFTLSQLDLWATRIIISWLSSWFILLYYINKYLLIKCKQKIITHLWSVLISIDTS